MKLAEALVVRADLQKRIAQARDRLSRNALVQEGEEPAEDPEELLREAEAMLEELEGYVTRINRTNLAATLGDEGGTTLTEALARRDVLGMRHGMLKALVGAASDRMPRYGRAEIRSVPTVEVRPLRLEMDRVAREMRELDTRIQAANWSTDLVED
jgi:hypothetical protein